MALNWASKYSGRWSAATTARPLGGAKNRTTETSEDGSYLEKSIFDAFTHLIAAPLALMGVTVNGADDVVGDSQYVRALKSLIAGGAQIYTDGGDGSNYQITSSHGEEITDLFNGMTVKFFANNDSEASATINVGSVGNKPIYLPQGSAIKEQSIRSGELTEVFYRESLDGFVLISTDFTEGVSEIVWTASESIAPTRRSIVADGSAISRNDYAALFNKIGTTFGDGDGSTTFNIPDLRGEFVRGFDDGRGVDSSRVFGSNQDAYLPPIPRDGWGTEGSAPGTITSGRLIVGSGTIEVGETLESLRGAGGDLTVSTGDLRARNVALMPWIKY